MKGQAHSIRQLGWFVVAGAAIAFGLAGARRADAATLRTTGARELWAFCGVHPSDPSAPRAAASMARDAGVTATFGPCNVPTRTYTADETADRYVDPDTYMRLVRINAVAGMKTLVYDRRIWSDDTATRDEAIAFWSPVLDDVAAWDMGDEFQPGLPQWQVLVARWTIVREQVTPRTGIKPFTNHVVDAVEQALADLPGSDELISFDHYNNDDMDVGGFVRTLDGRAHHVMCAVNALTHLVFTPTPELVRRDMATLAASGCDDFLVFGGERVYGTSDFGTSSLVDADGNATPLAAAFFEASGRAANAIADAATTPTTAVTETPVTTAPSITEPATPVTTPAVSAPIVTDKRHRWSLPSGRRMVTFAALPGIGLPIEIAVRRARSVAR